MDVPRIVVGLGNPGAEYARARHNVGFMTLERLAERWQIRLGPERSGLRTGCGVVAGKAVLLVEPRLYMNLSGEALRRIEAPWRIEDVLVVHDDIDLPFGRIRVRHDGGSGGHRGLISLVDPWGPEFDRVRVGVGRPPQGMDPADHVLQRLTEAEFTELRGVIERASNAVECLLAEGLSAAMNRFNAREPEDSRVVTVEPEAGAKRADAALRERGDAASENERESR